MKRVFFLFACLAFTTICRGASLVYSATSGQNSASVSFTMLSSGQLQVTLSNTSIMGAASPGDVLTAVYFDAPDVTVTPLSASANMGSIKNCITCLTAQTM